LAEGETDTRVNASACSAPRGPRPWHANEAPRAGTFYDTLFVELAVRTNCPLVTFDGALLKAFPEIARRPPAIVG
jgi:hypothetical protein